jgi:hypothetical protein
LPNLRPLLPHFLLQLAFRVARTTQANVDNTVIRAPGKLILLVNCSDRLRTDLTFVSEDMFILFMQIVINVGWCWDCRNPDLIQREVSISVSV